MYWEMSVCWQMAAKINGRDCSPELERESDSRKAAYSKADMRCRVESARVDNF